MALAAIPCFSSKRGLTESKLEETEICNPEYYFSGVSWSSTHLKTYTNTRLRFCLHLFQNAWREEEVGPTRLSIPSVFTMGCSLKRPDETASLYMS